MDFKLNKDKAVNSLLYVIERLERADKHKTFKILYFADQLHLAKYGRPIVGDTYCKLQYGPIPSYIKNIVDGCIPEYKDIVSLDKNHILTDYKAELDYLSDSDLECLNEAIEENKSLTFNQLTEKSHDEAYNAAIFNIDNIKIAKAKGANDDFLKYINIQIQNDNLSLA